MSAVDLAVLALLCAFMGVFAAQKPALFLWAIGLETAATGLVIAAGIEKFW
jgi:hypothetical protein